MCIKSQNKNFTVAFYFEHLVFSEEKERTDFKFLLPGHSFGAVDRGSGRAENTVLGSNEHIEVRQDYVQRINSSSLHPRITWIEMEQQNLKSYSTWLRARYIDRKKDIRDQEYHFSETMYFNFGIGERLDRDEEVKTFFFLFIMLRLRKLHSHMIIRAKKSKRNTIQYTGGADRDTTTAGSQLLWARIKEAKKVKKYS